MTRAGLLECLTDRPCSVCKFHKEKGCSKWECVFEEEPEEDEQPKEANLFLYDAEKKAYVPLKYEPYNAKCKDCKYYERDFSGIWKAFERLEEAHGKVQSDGQDMD
jgi:hypothetical protein